MLASPLRERRIGREKRGTDGDSSANNAVMAGAETRLTPRGRWRL